jgi:hypothetical protein
LKYNTAPIIIDRTALAVRSGQGLGSTRWKGNAWKAERGIVKLVGII